METAQTAAVTAPRWIASRTRPDEGAPSMSVTVRAQSTNVALIRFLEKWGPQTVGTRVNLRKPGSDPRTVDASYIRGEHTWTQVV